MYRKYICELGQYAYCNVKNEIYLIANRPSHTFKLYNGNFELVAEFKDKRPIIEVFNEVIKEPYKYYVK